MTSREPLPELTHDEAVRYSRHFVLPDVGMEGQRKLKAARVLVVGAGGLGSPVAMYLAAAGVGTLGLVEFDRVDLTNLQRQVIHGTSDVGRPKLDSARDRLRELNPHVHVEAYDTRLTSANALDVMRGYDLVVDGTDNFATRYLTNDACVMLGIPNVYGSIFRFEGQASVFATAEGPCYRCLFPEPPPPDSVPSCAEGGVFGALPGIIGSIQATEAIKLILGIGQPLAGRLLVFSALSMEFRTLKIRRNPQCPMCGTREIRELIDYDAFCAGPAVAHAANDPDPAEITPAELHARLERREPLQVIDVREPGEWAIGHLESSRLVPLGTLTASLGQMDPTRETILVCRTGARSARAAEQLAQAGFRDVKNLAGGLARWTREVDPRLGIY